MRTNEWYQKHLDTLFVLDVCTFLIAYFINDRKDYKKLRTIMRKVDWLKKGDILYRNMEKCTSDISREEMGRLLQLLCVMNAIRTSTFERALILATIVKRIAPHCYIISHNLHITLSEFVNLDEYEHMWNNINQRITPEIDDMVQKTVIEWYDFREKC
jgi:hypothetical protein